MEISDLVNKINVLNEEGIKLTMQAPPRYDEALAKHQEAVQLSSDKNLNPDYHAFSTANVAYAIRRKAEPQEKVLKLLDDAFQENMAAMGDWAAADSSRQESYAGTARLLEEMTIVLRTSPKATKDDLMVARGNVHMAVDLYESAVGNAPAEIITLPQLNSRLWRTLGVASTVATDLSKYFPHERKVYLKEAIVYAQQELDVRTAAGEKNGSPLANAYHTLGVAQTELANRDKNMYLAAKDNLQLGRQHAHDAGQLMSVSVMTFREAWLEYKRSPLNKKTIGNLVQIVVNQQSLEKMRWDNGVKNSLRARMTKLGAHLGGIYQQQIMQMYSV